MLNLLAKVRELAWVVEILDTVELLENLLNILQNHYTTVREIGNDLGKRL